MSNATGILSELREFVRTQASEDARLSAGERRHQAEIVTDVLKQEAPSAKALQTLKNEYFGQLATSRK